jgi:hypothetical protein
LLQRITQLPRSRTATGNDMHPPLDFRLLPILRKYSSGAVSAYDAACEIQELGLPGYHDPTAGDVVAWVREAGLGPPAATREDAEAEAAAILKRMRDG